MAESKFKTALADIKNLLDESGHFVKYAPFVTTDGKTIQIAGEIIATGASVLLGVEGSARMAAPTGTYTLEDGTEIIVNDGLIAKFTPGETETEAEKVIREAQEATAAAAAGANSTAEPAAAEPAAAALADFAEEQLADGTLVFVEPIGDNEWVGGKVFKTDESGARMDELVEDGEYTLADGKTLIIAGGLITEVRDAEEEIPEAIAAEITGFKKILEQKDEDFKSLKSEFETFKSESASIINKTFELVSKMAELPAKDSPRVTRFSKIEKSGLQKSKLLTNLGKLAEKNKNK